MRLARYTVPGLVHHVIVRFHDKRWLVRDDEERAFYLALLARAMNVSDWVCFAYAIMSSHLHLAMLAGESPPERWMRRVHPRFGAWVNERRGGLGGIFASRPRMRAVGPAKEMELINYLHHNPVRAGVVARPEDSTWTSHRAYLGLVTMPWLGIEQALGRSNHTRESFARLEAHAEAPTELPPLDRLHREARRRGPIELGTPLVGEQTVVPLLYRPGSHLRPHVESVLACACEVLGVRREVFMQRGPDAARGRAIVIQAGRALGLTIASMAVAVGITPQAGSKLANRTLTEAERGLTAAIVARIDDVLRREVAKSESVPR